MGLYTYDSSDIPKSERITKLVEDLYAKMPEIESARAVLITESYRRTEGEPIIMRRAKAFAHILENLPIVIRDQELIVGSTTIAPRGCQTYPEFSYEWLEDEFDTVETRSADPFYISEQTKQELKAANAYWKGKTTSELATSYMEPQTLLAMEHNMFTPGNYFYNGVGHVTVKYGEVLEIGFSGIRAKAEAELAKLSLADGDYQKRSRFLEAVMISCDAAVTYARRYAKLALEEAEKCTDPVRKMELLVIAQNCANVPEKGANGFYEACQSFWFVQQLLQIESSGHSISPGRFDQYMYPYYKKDLDSGKITREFAQELIDCIWVKMNDLNKCRDEESAKGFAGYSLFQNLIVGGQNKYGEDVTNDLSFMCIEASKQVFLPQGRGILRHGQHHGVARRPPGKGQCHGKGAGGRFNDGLAREQLVLFRRKGQHPLGHRIAGRAGGPIIIKVSIQPPFEPAGGKIAPQLHDRTGNQGLVDVWIDCHEIPPLRKPEQSAQNCLPCQGLPCWGSWQSIGL